jgi:hypothetical protein
MSDVARRRDLYLTPHNVQRRQTIMPVAGFEPAIPTSDRPPRLRARGHRDRQRDVLQL